MESKKLKLFKIITGFIFALIFGATVIYQLFEIDFFGFSNIKLTNGEFINLISIISISLCIICFSKSEKSSITVSTYESSKKLSKRALISSIIILLLIPFTIFFGMYFLNDRKYYFVSLIIIIETIIPFILIFEQRKPDARELVIISVLSAIAVLGRYAFSVFPQFKPIVAIIIIVGVCFGGETGFLTGAVSAFVSNFIFGQGPWTPWQMFSLGITGFAAGIFYKKHYIKKRKLSLSIFGGITTVVLYGGIMNASSVILFQPNPNIEMFIYSYSMGLPYDLIHAVSTMFFLWFFAEPVIEKIDRIKLKYGIIER